MGIPVFGNTDNFINISNRKFQNYKYYYVFTIKTRQTSGNQDIPSIRET